MNRCFLFTIILEGLFAESTGNQASYWNGPGPGGLVIKSGKWAAGLNLGRSSRQDGTVRKGGEQELTYLIMSSSQGTGAIHKNSMVLKLHYMKV
ncbi:hypothetical protein MTR67_043099 [Solanum verrucosum]|uniref:Uncharacterized protein n=1 Tax=Solanum verrucosum TaxID=315347 RepID=A0AAF0ZUT6_SOLVR|nr:hypothetical protein MTR67_043099 [Solanum verrucosum]